MHSARAPARREHLLLRPWAVVPAHGEAPWAWDVPPPLLRPQESQRGSPGPSLLPSMNNSSE